MLFGERQEYQLNARRLVSKQLELVTAGYDDPRFALAESFDNGSARLAFCPFLELVKVSGPIVAFRKRVVGIRPHFKGGILNQFKAFVMKLKGKILPAKGRVFRHHSPSFEAIIPRGVFNG